MKRRISWVICFKGICVLSQYDESATAMLVLWNMWCRTGRYMQLNENSCPLTPLFAWFKASASDILEFALQHYHTLLSYYSICQCPFPPSKPTCQRDCWLNVCLQLISLKPYIPINVILKFVYCRLQLIR